MMNRRAGKKDGEGGGKKGDSMTVKGPMSKEEKSVASWLRRNVPIKKTKFLNTHIVEYFIGSKAVDALVQDSPWASQKASTGLVFHSREDAIAYMDELLKHKMFHRAKKIPVPEKTKKIKGGKDAGGAKAGEASPQPGSTETGGKKKRKIRLDMHLDQVFLDSQDAYVWLYDPIPWYYWVGGTLIVLGIIGICLFPLWPPILRRGVHYLSIVGVGFLIIIFSLAAFQSVLFGILFVLSGGKLRFWLLPNLTEDVGFFQSFVPLYDYTYTGESKKKKKDKDSDDEEEESDEEDSDEKAGKSEDSDDSTSKKSSTGKDFEIVNKNDTDLEPDDN